MQQENVTTFMDWISEHWGWLAFIIASIAKFAQDHLRIQQMEKEVDKLKENDIEQTRLLASIDTKLDLVLSQVSDNKKDIKEIHKRSGGN